MRADMLLCDEPKLMFSKNKFLSDEPQSMYINTTFFCWCRSCFLRTWWQR